jgi:hypothetical protein
VANLFIRITWADGTIESEPLGDRSPMDLEREFAGSAKWSDLTQTLAAFQRVVIIDNDAIDEGAPPTRRSQPSIRRQPTSRGARR